jgi:hypothetical protein
MELDRGRDPPYVKERPFAWIDEEIDRDAHHCARRRPVSTLLLDVRADRGLTQDRIDPLPQFAANVSRSA